ncbi:flagellar export protein FliJ [Effusibacillus lacus]|uniref:Flagellar FliJ protein n=1 Tax=Effusibacillus lacus TaxID=1348429 RepID=A0A292YRA3_9BACL|nr:flagellar export protein FliJ [Effusibacillus lacus]TCS76031.1 flagellar export protein FliJ [Effusibacillus lacus]GAX91449.1 flagellar export protein FliJ [Effusibacillus lacus]
MSVPIKTIQKINSIKKMLVRQTEWEYSEVKRSLFQAEELLAGLEQELQDALDRFRDKQQEGLTPVELLDWTGWIDTQRMKIRSQVMQCRELEMQAEATRLRLVERQREEETWNNLKEKRLAALNYELQKQEQVELDEIGMQMRRYRGIGR